MYTVEQKIKNNIYIYEVESYWDKEKKQPRQRRKYIGKKNIDTGEIERPSKQYSCIDYGHMYLIKELDRRIGLTKILKKTFPEYYNEIINCAYFKICEGKPLYLCQPWLESVYHEVELDLYSQTLSTILRKISKMKDNIYRFFNKWIEITKPHNKFLVFDITSLSSYAKNINFTKWGYNRDKESLPQINLGVIYGEPSGLPLFYSIYPGSIHDVKTLKNIISQMDILSLNNTVFVLDKGFYSKKNLSYMTKYKHIIPFPIRNKQENILIDKYCSIISDTKNAIKYSKRIYFCVKEIIDISGMTYTAYVYLDEKKRISEKEVFLKTILEIEKYINTNEFSTTDEVLEFITEINTEYTSYFKISCRGNKIVAYRNSKAIENSMKRMGMFVLITNTSMPGEEVIEMYRQKDGVEKYFDSLKNSINQKRLHIHSQETLEGLLFIDFISLILHSKMLRIMRENNLRNKFSASEIIMELRNIREIIIGEKKTFVTEVSKLQRKLYSYFDLSPPA